MIDLLELDFFNVAAEHSESPMYWVFPALRISSRALIDSSSGVSITKSADENHIMVGALLGSIRWR